MGISGICPGPNLSKRNLAHAIYPYLLRNVSAGYPNHVWGVDITYIRLRQRWMYLVAILTGTCYVVNWQLDDSLEIDFVLVTVDAALAQAKPLVWNSDRAPVGAFIFSGGDTPSQWRWELLSVLPKVED